jgi:hypothetical protein
MTGTPMGVPGPKRSFGNSRFSLVKPTAQSLQADATLLYEGSPSQYREHLI